MNGTSVPRAILGATGVTAIEIKAAGVTVRVTGLEVTAPMIAVTVVLPEVRDVANPLDPGALLTEATEPEEEIQVAEVVRLWVELSEKMPMAVNAWPVPSEIRDTAGVTPMETKVAAVTVSATGAELTAPSVAVMFVEPTEWLVTNPDVVSPLLTSATPAAFDVQVTAPVRS